MKCLTECDKNLQDITESGNGASKDSPMNTTEVGTDVPSVTNEIIDSTHINSSLSPDSNLVKIPSIIIETTCVNVVNTENTSHNLSEMLQHEHDYAKSEKMYENELKLLQCHETFDEKSSDSSDNELFSIFQNQNKHILNDVVTFLESGKEIGNLSRKKPKPQLNDNISNVVANLSMLQLKSAKKIIDEDLSENTNNNIMKENFITSLNLEPITTKTSKDTLKPENKKKGLLKRTTTLVATVSKTDRKRKLGRPRSNADDQKNSTDAAESYINNNKLSGDAVITKRKRRRENINTEHNIKTKEDKTTQNTKNPSLLHNIILGHASQKSGSIKRSRRKRKITRRFCSDDGSSSIKKRKAINEDVGEENSKTIVIEQQCYICFKAFETENKLIRHRMKHFNNDSKRSLKKCPLCDFTSSYIIKHLRRVHNVIIKIPYTCVEEELDGSDFRYYLEIDDSNIKRIEVIPTKKKINQKADNRAIDRENKERDVQVVAKKKILKRRYKRTVKRDKFDKDGGIIPVLHTFDESDDFDNTDKLFKVSANKTIFMCKHCDMIFENQAALKLHNRQHNHKSTALRSKKQNNSSKTSKVDKEKEKGKGIRKKKVKRVTNKKIQGNDKPPKPKPVKDNYKCNPELQASEIEADTTEEGTAIEYLEDESISEEYYDIIQEESEKPVEENTLDSSQQCETESYITEYLEDELDNVINDLHQSEDESCSLEYLEDEAENIMEKEHERQTEEIPIDDTRQFEKEIYETEYLDDPDNNIDKENETQSEEIPFDDTRPFEKEKYETEYLDDLDNYIDKENETQSEEIPFDDSRQLEEENYVLEYLEADTENIERDETQTEEIPFDDSRQLEEENYVLEYLENEIENIDKDETQTEEIPFELEDNSYSMQYSKNKTKSKLTNISKEYEKLVQNTIEVKQKQHKPPRKSISNKKYKIKDIKRRAQEIAKKIIQN